MGWLWHRRLAHVDMRNLQSLLKVEHIVGPSDVSFAEDHVCSSCIAGKQHEKQHKMKTIITSTRPLELLHLDLFGLHPMIAWVGGGIALSLSTTISDIHGFSFSRTKMRLKIPLYHLPKKLNININVRLWLFEVTMVPTSRITLWMSS